MTVLQLQIEGIGVWAPGIADYQQLTKPSSMAEAAIAPPRPPAHSLSPNERRRAPESVLLAVEAADQAIAMSGRTPASLLSVFSSVRGDQAITDYMCHALTGDPFGLSPTKFHNSVHNAAAGYWSIAVEATGGASSVSADPRWTGLALLDAITLAVTEQQPVLWVCFETRGAGPLLQLSGWPHGMACAMVLAPVEPDTSRPRLDATVLSTEDTPPATGHPVASLLPWLAGLAAGADFRLPVSPRLTLRIETQAGVL